jgi:cation diffusion facilitator family transporter
MRPLRIQLFVILAGLLLMALKAYAWFITGSLAILSDALESIVNLIAGGMAFYSLWLAGRPSDKEHPYGHGKVEFISALVEGVLILLAAFAISWKSINGLFSPTPLNALSTGVALTAFCGAAHFAMAKILLNASKKHRSQALEGEGRHLMSDALSSLALILGLGVMWLTGQYWIDPVISMVFAAYIAFTGVRLIRKSLGGIMDEADPEVLKEVGEVLNRVRTPDIVDVHNLRVIRYGGDVHIDAHATIPWYWSVQEGHDRLDNLAEDLRNHFPKEVEVFLHADPCLPTSCKLCTLLDCPHRTEPFSKETPWTLSALTTNRRHGLQTKSE